MTKDDLAKQIVDEWESWNNESISDAPDKMREEFMETMSLADIISRAPEWKLRRWLERIRSERDRDARQYWCRSAPGDPDAPRPL